MATWTARTTTGQGEIMEIAEIAEFLEKEKGNEGVKALLSKYSQVSPESVKAFLETQDGSRLIQPIADKRVQDAIKTFKEGHFEDEVKARVAAETLKINPIETKEMKQIRELQEKFDKSEKDRTRAELRRQVIELLSQENIPSWWIDDFAGNSVDEAKVFAQKVKQSYDDEIAKATNKILASGYKPQSGNEQKDPLKMSPADRKAYYEAEAMKRLAPKA